jgi:exodeoxyribonuclease VII small subunit
MGTRREGKVDPADATPAAPLDVDQGLLRLEAIVAELDSGKLGLEASIERYGQGIALLKHCHEVLSSHRRRVEELTRDAERALVAFDQDPDAPAAGADGTARRR